MLKTNLMKKLTLLLLIVFSVKTSFPQTIISDNDKATIDSLKATKQPHFIEIENFKAKIISPESLKYFETVEKLVRGEVSEEFEIYQRIKKSEQERKDAIQKAEQEKKDVIIQVLVRKQRILFYGSCIISILAIGFAIYTLRKQKLPAEASSA